jgi:hypothetical protein
MKGDLVMKFPALVLLIALSPAAALAAGPDGSDNRPNPLQVSKAGAVSVQTGPGAAAEKTLRWGCEKKPVPTGFRDSAEVDASKKPVKVSVPVKPSTDQPRRVDGLVKPIKITPLVKPSSTCLMTGQAEPVKIVKRSPEAAGAPQHKPGPVRKG